MDKLSETAKAVLIIIFVFAVLIIIVRVCADCKPDEEQSGATVYVELPVQTHTNRIEIVNSPGVNLVFSEQTLSSATVNGQPRGQTSYVFNSRYTSRGGMYNGGASSSSAPPASPPAPPYRSPTSNRTADDPPPSYDDFLKHYQ